MATKRVRGGMALLAALGLALTACGGSDDDALTTPTTAAGASPTTGPATPATTVAPGAGSTVVSEPDGESACPALPAVPTQATDESIPVDFDGDGTADSLRAYLADGDWHVRGEMGGVGFHDQVVVPRGPAGLEPLFGARLNPSDDTEEAWVRIGTGAYAGIVTIFVFRDCELQRPTLDGEPVELAVGASVKNAAGVSCFMFDQGIEVFDTQSDDGVNFTGESQLYTLDVTSQPAPTLEPVAGWPMPVSTDNPAAHLSQLTCGSKVHP